MRERLTAAPSERASCADDHHHHLHHQDFLTGPAPPVAEWEQALAEGMLATSGNDGNRAAARNGSSHSAVQRTAGRVSRLHGRNRLRPDNTVAAAVLSASRECCDLLAKFWLTTPPEMSAAAEAVQFGKLSPRHRAPSIPLLKEMTSFEMAAAYCRDDERTSNRRDRLRHPARHRRAGRWRRPEPPGPTLFKFIIDPPARRSVLS